MSENVLIPESIKRSILPKIEVNMISIMQEGILVEVPEISLSKQQEPSYPDNVKTTINIVKNLIEDCNKLVLTRFYPDEHVAHKLLERVFMMNRVKVAIYSEESEEYQVIRSLRYENPEIIERYSKIH